MTAVVTWAKTALRLGSIEFLIAVIVVGALLLFVRPRLGRRWIAAVALAYWFLSSPFGSRLVVAPLIRGFHPIESPDEARSAEAIVVLGGGVRELTARAGSLSDLSEPATLRVLEAVRVYRLLAGRPLIVASGGIVGEDHRTPESEVLAEAMIKLGVSRDNIIAESDSRTTREQAILVTRLLRARGIERFVLVTSPTHMSRSVAVFRAQHADVVPSMAPLASQHSRARPFFMPDGESLEIADSAVYGYAGLLYYWARGWFKPDSVPVAK